MRGLLANLFASPPKLVLATPPTGTQRLPNQKHKRALMATEAKLRFSTVQLSNTNFLNLHDISIQVMEQFQEAREKAKKNVKAADHMIYITYNLVQDPKLLLAVMENLFLSLTNAMAALLYYERTFKRIPPFHDNFEAKYVLLRDKVGPKYNIDKEYVEMIRDIKEMIVQHKTSPIEFVRKDRFVICDGSYKMKTVSVDQMKRYVGKTKEFIREIEKITSKNEGIFTRS